MKTTIKREVEVEIELDADAIAEAFADLNAREQAQFFCKVAEIMATWPCGHGQQVYGIGEIMRGAPFAARRVVLDLASAIENKS